MKKTTKKPIGTIAQERKDCIAAFKQYPKSENCWCCHHKILMERLHRYWDGFMERIKYIDAEKERSEKAVRFRNFRPVKSAKFSPHDGDLINHRRLNREWPNNTWDGNRDSIFGK